MLCLCFLRSHFAFLDLWRKQAEGGYLRAQAKNNEVDKSHKFAYLTMGNTSFSALLVIFLLPVHF